MPNIWSLPPQNWYAIGVQINEWNESPDPKPDIADEISKKFGLDREHLYIAAKIARHIPLDLILKYPNVPFRHWRNLSYVRDDRFKVVELIAHRVSTSDGRLTPLLVQAQVDEYNNIVALIKDAEKFNAEQV